MLRDWTMMRHELTKKGKRIMVSSHNHLLTFLLLSFSFLVNVKVEDDTKGHVNTNAHLLYASIIVKMHGIQRERLYFTFRATNNNKQQRLTTTNKNQERQWGILLLLLLFSFPTCTSMIHTYLHGHIP